MVRLARAMLEDGFTTSGNAAVIREIAQLREDNSEDKIHEVLNKHQLALPVPLKPITGKPKLKGFPRLKPMDFLLYMAESGHLNKLLGGRSIQNSGRELQAFWDNYRKLHPDFELFHMTNMDLNLSDCIPIVAHIDGGRGYKKSEFLVFSFASMIGSGSGRNNLKDPGVRSFKKKKAGLQIPLLGHSYLSHYLYAAMPCSFHKQDDEALQQILEAFAEDIRECFDEGIGFRGRVIRLVLLGLKGDLKMQARAGRLTRWYATARKRPFDETKKTQSKGLCCWLCPAGDITVPYEQIATKHPAWRAAMVNFSEPPWAEGREGGMIPSSLSYLSRPEKFYLPDLFHIYLAGVGQDYAASCLVYMLPLMFKGTGGDSVDAQLTTLNATFKLWRKMFKVSVNLTSFNRDRLTFPDAKKVFPTGTWSKAADTSRIIQFISYACSLFPELCDPAADEICYHISISAKAIGDMMQGLYAADLWIAPCLSDRVYYAIVLKLCRVQCSCYSYFRKQQALNTWIPSLGFPHQSC